MSPGVGFTRPGRQRRLGRGVSLPLISDCIISENRANSVGGIGNDDPLFRDHEVERILVPDDIGVVADSAPIGICP